LELSPTVIGGNRLELSQESYDLPG
jgi:hypothetical protein